MNIRMYAALLIVVGFAAAAGCEDRGKVTALEAKISELTKQVSEVQRQLEAANQARDFERTLRTLETVAYLTPGDDGYSLVESDLGRMTVKLANVQPYANGSRVTLQFGNLTSATVNGARTKLEWGAVDEKGSPQNESARSRDVTFSQSLRAGAWTSVPVVLEGVQPAELGFVRIRDFGHSGISLLK